MTEKEAWTMEPIRDSHKLTLMRCAYQNAVASCYGEKIVPKNEYKLYEYKLYEDETDVLDSKGDKVPIYMRHPDGTFALMNGEKQQKTKMDAKGEEQPQFEKYKVGDPILDANGNKLLVKRGCPGCEPLLKGFHAHDDGTGIDATCVKKLGDINTAWFGAGSKDEVPDDCGCIYVGHYCDQYVWVLPEHRDKLTQLTLAILDYAVHNHPSPVTNEEVTTVTTYDDKKREKTSVKMTRQVPVTETVRVPKLDERGNPVLDERSNPVIESVTRNKFRRPTRTIDSSGTSLRALQQRLQLRE